MGFNLSYILNKFLPTKITSKETKLIKIRDQTVAPNESFLLATVGENDVFTNAKVSLRQNPQNGSLYAQHMNELGQDMGTTQLSRTSHTIQHLNAEKRSSIMRIYYRNLGDSDITINADIILSVEATRESFLQSGSHAEFKQKGDAITGAAYTRLFVDGENAVSEQNPLPVTVQGQSTEIVFDGALLAEKYGEPGTNLNLSAEVDHNGQGVLRTIDANPWAYDTKNDTKKIQYAPKTWSITRESDNAMLNATKPSEAAKYHIIKGAYVSVSDGITPVKWAILDDDTIIAQGYAVGSGLQLTSPIKITDGNSVTLRCWASGEAGVKVAATLIGETLEV